MQDMDDDNPDIKSKIICSMDTVLQTAKHIAISNDVNQVITVEFPSIGETEYRKTKSDSYVNRTLFSIAFHFRDRQLLEYLVDKGVDVNQTIHEEFHTNHCDEVTALYCAAINQEVDFIKFLIDKGSSVNLFQGLDQPINLQVPTESRAIIGPVRQLHARVFHFRTATCNIDDIKNFLQVLDLYLKSGVKMNTTSWGPCLFLGRGKKYKANRPTTIHVFGPWFICTAAVILLQHGIDPNQYCLKHVLKQVSCHPFHVRYPEICVPKSVFLHTFLAAGFKLNRQNILDSDKYLDDASPHENSRYLLSLYGSTASLKHIVRTSIRRRLLFVNNDTSVFSAIDELQLPTLLKDYLKLYDIVPCDVTSILCHEHRKPRCTGY